jgi:hypothetical protein
LIRTRIDDENDRMFYCSVSTHQEKPFTQAETMIMKAHITGFKKNGKPIKKNDRLQTQGHTILHYSNLISNNVYNEAAPQLAKVDYPKVIVPEKKGEF